MLTPSQRILIIDDSEAVLRELETALSAAGYEVTVTTQTVGIGRLLRHCDLVILDYHMPGLHGREVLESLRAASAASEENPLFYLYTSDAAVARQAKQLGFDGVFSQKGEADALVRQVDATFRLEKLRGLRRPKS